MPIVTNFKESLKHEGLKNTRHRNEILNLIEKSDQPINADKIYYSLLAKNISINLSTIYRVLNTLVDKGLILKSNITGEAKTFFEINYKEHKHHVVCVECKKMFAVDGCPFEEYEKLLKEKNGFNILGHKLEIFGVCKDCTIHNHVPNI